MAGLLSNLADNLVEGIYKINYKYGHNNEQCETCRVK